MPNEDLRVGDRERDEAVELLQEHMSAGRLSADEFGDRMSRALEARTWRDLDVLFTDLPGRRPGRPEQSVITSGSSSVWGAPTDAQRYGSAPVPPEVQHKSAGAPWYAQWWLLMVAIMLTVMIGDWFGFLIPAAAIWIWVVAPALDKERRRRQQAVAAPPRPLTFHEREELLDEIRAGHPTSAIKRYRELTGADLYTAKMTVDALRREIGN